MASAVGCGEKTSSSETKRLTRSRDAAYVVVVDRAAASVVDFAEEVEPNNEPDKATAMELGGAVKGVLDGSSDIDLYTFTAAADGVATITLGGIEGVDLMIELRDADNKPLAVSDRGPAQVVEGIPNYGVTKGTKYLVAIKEFVKPVKKRRRKRKKKDKDAPTAETRTGPSPPYELVTKYATAAEPLYEAEPNADVDGAIEALLGDQLYGYIGWIGDVDMWKLSLEGFNTTRYSLDVTVEGVDGVTFAMEILDGEGAVVLARSANKGQPLFVRNLVPAGTGHYLAKLSAKRSNPEQAYAFAVATRALDEDDEREPNDKREMATPLRADETATEGQRLGYLLGGDVDFFMLKNGGEEALVNVSVEGSAANDFELEVFAGKKSIGKAQAGKAGAREELNGLSLAAKKELFVVVRGTFKGSQAESYTLRWSAAPGGVANDDGNSGLDLDDLGME
jgi:hypothetical protein